MATIRVVILPDGGMGFFQENGSPLQGIETINAVLSQLQEEGVTFERIEPPEQHRAGQQHTQESADLRPQGDSHA